MAWKERLFLVSIIIGLIVALFFTIDAYENRILKEEFRVVDGKKIKKKYTKQEILEMIKSLPDYQGDSLTIFEDGTIRSSIPELDGGLNYAQTDKATRKYLEDIARNEHLPFAFVVYKHVLPYYINEHIKKKKTDTISKNN
ncbi:hypothetical protein [Raineya orbicola]|jgi:hypothetical protein|uniref:Uncharacterized protein n=1 Tax=Raineya orbicola TaxID=2016530 RepID=A0A2N3I7D4_9BACT|nr:hypothetical protein [Raineya orbicola]PKQ66205.1 hypothetical protein Rain11_2443 [Raineya orbicola]